jgi:7-cyano-7-deazaguanine synthase
METVIAITSGGLDSVTLAHQLRAEVVDLHLLSFDYGQRHRKELDFAGLCAKRLGAGFDRVDISGLGSLLGGSALTDGGLDVPEGHYAEETMAVTVVPNRNSIMLSIAYGVAVAEGADMVAIAAHAGDHFVYPDCRPAFVEAFDAMERVAVEGFGKPGLRLHAPFLQVSKSEIVRLGARLGVPFEETWSCYVGGELHCGRCGTCVERREAFELAGIPDPTGYEIQPASGRGRSQI